MDTTWSKGDQRGLQGLPGSLADCGQFAAGGVAGDYRVGSIDPNPPYQEQPRAVRTPVTFVPAHGRMGATFAQSTVPPRAQGVAYRNLNTGVVHFARLEANGTLIQTDALRQGEQGKGGTFMKFRSGPNGRPSLATVAGQRAVQPAEIVPNVAAFVAYCDGRYGTMSGANVTGLFYFCRFDP